MIIFLDIFLSFQNYRKFVMSMDGYTFVPKYTLRFVPNIIKYPLFYYNLWLLCYLTFYFT
ncbi:hypothetical protein LCGC14_0708400 [marine sediment metagenome]|uniref:Uncharacterized protein n=1 Tax=marine sediment metagenome TaxID=412755 RepID=A0A0F9T1Q3_9ZZZZ